jgi:hypothetical protein
MQPALASGEAHGGPDLLLSNAHFVLNSTWRPPPLCADAPYVPSSPYFVLLLLPHRGLAFLGERLALALALAQVTDSVNP